MQLVSAIITNQCSLLPPTFVLLASKLQTNSTVSLNSLVYKVINPMLSSLLLDIIQE